MNEEQEKLIEDAMWHARRLAEAIEAAGLCPNAEDCEDDLFFTVNTHGSIGHENAISVGSHHGDIGTGYSYRNGGKAYIELRDEE